MIQPAIKSIYLLLFVFISCQRGYQITYELPGRSEPLQKTIKLNRSYSTHEIEILENTLDDTCKIGVVLIPPRKTGIISTTEFYRSILKYTYDPYRAKNGLLKIKHTFY